MKIKVKLFDKACKFDVIKKGEWIDLRNAEIIELKAPFANVLSKGRTVRTVEFDYKLIPLGIGMKLPKGIEAHILPRSSTFLNYSITSWNSEGIIDSTYCGPDDQWKFPAVAWDDIVIPKGERICQFRLQLSQKATIWQKIKWLFTNKIKFEFVDNYEGENRGGFGSTGVK